MDRDRLVAIRRIAADIRDRVSSRDRSATKISRIGSIVGCHRYIAAARITNCAAGGYELRQIGGSCRYIPETVYGDIARAGCNRDGLILNRHLQATNTLTAIVVRNRQRHIERLRTIATYINDDHLIGCIPNDGCIPGHLPQVGRHVHGCLVYYASRKRTQRSVNLGGDATGRQLIYNDVRRTCRRDAICSHNHSVCTGISQCRWRNHRIRFRRRVPSRASPAVCCLRNRLSRKRDIPAFADWTIVRRDTGRRRRRHALNVGALDLVVLITQRAFVKFIQEEMIRATAYRGGPQSLAVTDVGGERIDSNGQMTRHLNHNICRRGSPCQ